MDVIRQDKALFGCDVNAEAKAVACGNGTHINVWDLASGRRNNTLRIHKRTVVSIAYPKPELLISGSDDKTLCFWNPCDQSAPLLRRVEIGVPVYTLKVYDDGTAFFLIGILADMLTRVRKNSERALYYLKKNI
jgi:WD40 repeat protein